MKKLKYQTKFLLYHTAIMILIIIGLAGYFYTVVVGEMREKERSDFRIIAEKTAAQIDNIYYEMDRAALQIAANPDIVDVFQPLAGAHEGNYFTEHPIAKNHVKRLLESYNFKNDGHARICLYNQSRDFVCTANRAVTDAGIEHFFGGEAFAEVREFFAEENRFVFYREPAPDVLAFGEGGQTRYFAVVREIKDYFSESSRCGYIEVQESVDKLETALSGMGTGVRAELLNSGGNAVYTVTEGRIDWDDDELYTVDIALDNAPYTLRVYKNPVEFLESVEQFYLAMGVAVIVIFGVAFSLEHVLIRHLSKPLVDLDRSLKSVTMDNLHVEIAEEDSEDLVIRLEDSFNSMLEKLNDSMQREVIARTNEVKSHLFALQSQMNPHFLHNILAIISMESQLDGSERVPDICRRLGKILRYNSEMGDGYSTIGEECETAEDYMQLMKIRYEDAFEYSIEADENALQLQIPKFVVQPLCENCFQHGLRQIEPVWRISVRAWREQNKWFLMIRDNGSGFTDEFMEEFRRMKEELDSNDAKYILEHISIGGLSIPNIYTRMRIAYGETFTFKLYNENGAVVMLGGEADDKGISGGR